MLRGLAGWIAALALAAAAGAQTLRVYEVRHRTAEELAPLVETAMGGEGRVVADTRSNKLVLSGSPAAIESALSVLDALDLRARTVLVRYEARTGRDLASAGASVSWRAAAGGLRIADVSWPAGAPASIAVRVDVEDLRSRRSQTSAGTLRILEGESGRISTGASVPVTTRRRVRGPDGPVTLESTQLVAADSGFEARPRVLGDGRIELALRRFDAQVRGDGRIAHSGADTVLVLEPGRTLAVGGILREAREQESAIGGGAGRASADESLLLVTAEIE